MAVLKAEIKRGFLRSLARGAANTQLTLAATLAAFQDQGFSAIKTGKQLVVTSGNGHSASFKIPMPGDALTPDEVFCLSEELLNTYDAALVTLGYTAAADTSQDSAILTTMLAADNMQTVTQSRDDFTTLRFSNAGVGNV